MNIHFPPNSEYIKIYARKRRAYPLDRFGQLEVSFGEGNETVLDPWPELGGIWDPYKYTTRHACTHLSYSHTLSKSCLRTLAHVLTIPLTSTFLTQDGVRFPRGNGGHTRFDPFFFGCGMRIGPT